MGVTEDATLHVAHVLASDSSTPYTAHVPRMVRSCARHTSGPLHFHLVADTNDRGSAFATNMTATFQRYGRVSWHWHSDSADKLRGLTHHHAVLLKLFLPSIVPAAVGRLLFVDTDTVCTGSLRQIAEAHSGSPMSMAHAFNGPSTEFNSGVIVFDMRQLQAMRWGDAVRRLLRDVHLGRLKVGRPCGQARSHHQPCGGWSDQDVFNRLNRNVAGALIHRVPCWANVQIVASSELQSCLNNGSRAPAVLHSHQRSWKMRLLDRSPAAQRHGWAGATQPERMAAQLFLDAARPQVTHRRSAADGCASCIGVAQSRYRADRVSRRR